MANQIPDDALTAIEKVIRLQTGTVPAPEILQALPTPIPQRTRQYRLKRLVSDRRLIMESGGRWAKYRLPDIVSNAAPSGEDQALVIALSDAAKSVCDYVRQAPEARTPAGYNRNFIDQYRPNLTFYLTKDERAHLASVGRPKIPEQPAGTYAKQILNRLPIDLAWNSSRLEGKCPRSHSI